MLCWGSKAAAEPQGFSNPLVRLHSFSAIILDQRRLSAAEFILPTTANNVLVAEELVEARI
jgi:hypothetical protein